MHTVTMVTSADGTAISPSTPLRRSGLVTFTVRSVTMPVGTVWDGVTPSTNARL